MRSYAIWRMVAVGAFALAFTGAHAADDIPQYVKGPVSGFVYDCQEARQKAPRPEAYVTSGDLDGDGKPDHVIDSGKGCQSNRDLYCTADGCTITIYLSSTYGFAGSHKVKSFKIGRHGDKPALLVEQTGGDCGTAGGACARALVFNGEAFVPAK